MKWKAGDECYVYAPHSNGIEEGIYIITEILEDNIDSNGIEYPVNIFELPINLTYDEIRLVTKLDRALK